MKHVFIKSNFGPIRLDFDGESLLRVTQVSRKGASDIIDPDLLNPIIQCINGERDGLGIPVKFEGTPFQIKVWEAMRLIRPGEVLSYSELAKRAGNMRATRAVASACGRNPCVIVVPCHRIIRRDGGLGGFAWGIPLKRSLLIREGVRIGSDLKVL
ncbi:MAG: methylated-DNA--[protein]-cysteine S-methyltransferase [Litoricolaceae bacterium]|nr:methylated-DNA--[protein]-cysteine S-methyltransferase [Litorivicinaceae bacterium]